MEVRRLDHVAIAVPHLGHARQLFEGPLNMSLRRTGTRKATGAPLVMLGDPFGTKLEMVEESPSGVPLMHMAFLVDDVDEVSEVLTASHDCSMLRPKVWLASARADFTTVQHASGLEIQLVRYDDDSPDR